SLLDMSWAPSSGTDLNSQSPGPMFLFRSRRHVRIILMARSNAAVRRPPAPSPSWPSPPTPAGGFARRSGSIPPRAAAAALAPPVAGDGAVASARCRGRGAQSNAPGRYEPLARIAFDDGWESFEELPSFKTMVTLDSTRKIITRNDSPDISFDRSINPY